jgi:hypothetical protein
LDNFFFVKGSNGGNIHSEGTQAATFKIAINTDGSIYLNVWNYNYTGNWLGTTSNTIVQNINEWNYIVLSLKNGGTGVGDLSFYINGQLKDTKICQKEYHVSTRYAMFGDNIGAYDVNPQSHLYFIGSLDEFKIYNKDLSQAEIRKTYISGLDYLLKNKLISKEEYSQRINN